MADSTVGLQFHGLWWMLSSPLPAGDEACIVARRCICTLKDACMGTNDTLGLPDVCHIAAISNEFESA